MTSCPLKHLTFERKRCVQGCSDISHFKNHLLLFFKSLKQLTSLCCLQVLSLFVFWVWFQDEALIFWSDISASVLGLSLNTAPKWLWQKKKRCVWWIIDPCHISCLCRFVYDQELKEFNLKSGGTFWWGLYFGSGAVALNFWLLKDWKTWKLSANKRTR